MNSGEAAGFSVTETKLIAIWCDVLRKELIQADDDFVDIGGDSLSAMLCIYRVQAEFGIDLDLEDFFFEPATVRGLAAIVDRATAG